MSSKIPLKKSAPATQAATTSLEPQAFSLWTIFGISMRSSLLAFGGGMAYTPMMQRELVNSHQWMTLEEFLDCATVARSCPGAIGINSAVALGYRLQGFAGALASVAGVLAPTMGLVIVLAMLLARQMANPVAQKAYIAIRPAVVGLVLAIWAEMATVVLRRRVSHWALFLGSVLAILWLKLSPLFIILFAGLAGYLFMGHKAPQSGKE